MTVKKTATLNEAKNVVFPIVANFGQNRLEGQWSENADRYYQARLPSHWRKDLPADTALLRRRQTSKQGAGVC